MIDSLFQQAESALKAQGGRMTNQRKLILEKLATMPGHPTAEEVFLAVSREDQGLNLSTVYRTLRWLADSSLIKPRRFDEERRQERFDSTSAPTNEDHYHFQCHQCKKIIEFSSDQVEQIKVLFSAQNGITVDYADLILYGTCAECSNTE